MFAWLRPFDPWHSMEVNLCTNLIWLNWNNNLLTSQRQYLTMLGSDWTKSIRQCHIELHKSMLCVLRLIKMSATECRRVEPVFWNAVAWVWHSVVILMNWGSALWLIREVVCTMLRICSHICLVLLNSILRRFCATFLLWFALFQPKGFQHLIQLKSCKHSCEVDLLRQKEVCRYQILPYVTSSAGHHQESSACDEAIILLVRSLMDNIYRNYDRTKRFWEHSLRS